MPLLTRRGTAFPGPGRRQPVAAAGLPELVTQSAEDYENMALKLSHSPDLLKSLRDRLTANRAIAPLFDTARTTRHMEAAYRLMLENWERGNPARSFAV